MLHLLFEDNSELKHRTFPIPTGVMKHLRQVITSYNGDKMADGYKRLSNLVGDGNVSYAEMKRIKNFFDNYNGTEKADVFTLNGGDIMRNWVNNTLNAATAAVHDFKQAKKDIGMKNAFIKPHEKDRQIKKKNKPTYSTIKTDNTAKRLADDSLVKYESKKKVIVITEKQAEEISEMI